MEKDERLLPLPTAKEVQLSTHEYPAAYSPIYEEEGFAEIALQQFQSAIGAERRGRGRQDPGIEAAVGPVAPDGLCVRQDGFPRIAGQPVAGHG